MRSADIQAVLDSDPSVDWAVLVPTFRYGRRDGSDIVKAQIDSVEGHRVLLRAEPTADHPKTVVQPARVLATWESHEKARRTAAEKRQRESDRQRAEYDARKAAQAAEVEAVLPVFAGIMVPAPGAANFERPPEDAADVLRETFCEDGAAGSMFSREFFVALGQGLLAKQRMDRTWESD